MVYISYYPFLTDKKTDLKELKTLVDYMNNGFCGEYGDSFETSVQRTKRLKCASGLTFSIQAGNHAYCYPRENTQTDYSFYTEFEIGFPSEKIEGLMSYAENESDPTGTVYGYVPKGLIEKVIQENGGIIGYAN